MKKCRPAKAVAAFLSEYADEETRTLIRWNIYAKRGCFGCRPSGTAYESR